MATAKILNRQVYRDKVYGCWTGKAAGGTLGAPFEWSTKMNSVSFYPPEIQGANIPNDDLDLQLVFLAAVERYGALNVNERILAEYWSELITGPWNEYGDVRGLYAPPRRNCAPPFFAISAASKSCSRLSTAQGPAITMNSSPPMGTPSTSMTLD